ncbi:MAG TPA: sugar phosphate isomerase/epimerase [Armatimonadota bacterium]|nr:sugar phosphate isomerase/epimerase [Armatimonadota bacterium]
MQNLHIATNSYPWSTFYRREGRSFEADLDAGLAAVAASGADGYEGAFTTPEELEQTAGLLRRHGLEMRSLYSGATLHDPEKVDENISRVLAVAATARSVGTRIVVVNPAPLQWGGPADKNDAQLCIQAEALARLGREIKALDMVLAYHNHDAELRSAAREFHHMMLGTDPGHVSLCLDAHWIYRGSGNSSVALFDVLTLYGSRVVELHLRQSAAGVWTEAFGDGDIDYHLLAQRVKEHGKPHLVMEQAVEESTPVTLGVVEAHRRSFAYARGIFG